MHLARIFGILVETWTELPVNDPRRKFKFRAVHHGDKNVICQDLGSSPASMEAGEMADAYGSDAEQAYIQAELEGGDMVHLPS